MTDDRAERIAELNDNLRTTFNPRAGRILLTHGINSLDDGDREQILSLVKTFNNFSEDNDPYEEHDFGKVEYNDVSAFFKFDYYDKSLKRGSPDPSDSEVTERVMTVMLSSEY